MKYSLNDIQRGIQDPYLIAKEINQLYHKNIGEIRFNHQGTGIFDLDWDNLIILDACRYDVYADSNPFPGETSYRYALKTKTSKFIRENFTNRTQYDLIYISENGWYEKLRDEINAEIFKWSLQTDEHFPTRHERTTDIVLELSDKFPNKRFLIHYLPPHHPYYGPLAEKHLPESKEQFGDLFGRIRKGHIDISDKMLREIYRENLERVFPHVSELLDSLSGKTVITADHGEFLGERSSPIPIRRYGHPEIYSEELTKVPWHVHEQGPRKTIREGSPERDKPKQLDQCLDEHLRDLGYVV